MSLEMEKDTIDVLDFSDGMSAEKAKNAKKTAARLFRRLAAQKGKLAVIFISVLCSCAFTIAAPMIIGQAVNLLFDGIRTAAATGEAFRISAGAMGGVLLSLLALYLFSVAFTYLQQHLMAGVAQTLTLSIRGELSGKLNRLPLQYYDRHQRGDLLSRITNDLEKVSDTLQDGFMQLMSATVTTIGAVILMLTISPLLTVIALVTIVLAIGSTALVAGTSQRCFSENQEALGVFNGRIEELFTGQTVIKAFGREQDAIRDVREANERLYKASCGAQFISYAVTPAIRLVNQIGYVVIAVLGGIFVAGGSLSLGVVQAFFQYVTQASEPLTEAAYVANMMQAAIASAERVFELLDEPDEEPDAPDAAIPQNPAGAVCFEHVRFGYSADQMLMDDVNISLRAGDKIAVVGPTGAGKTTLVNLLMRFYELRGGRITIDGADIRDMPRGGLRSLFGMVLQDTWLFGGTVEENIAYSRADASPEDIRRAAKAARADHFIRTLPEGYQTVLNEEGSNISQGQRQLLTIARAILADPAILILDEATSSVDTRTELEIQKATDALMKGRTSFVIAHRLSTIRDADLILVMRDGTIIEQGSHETLLAQNGFYQQLYNSQFAAKPA